MFDRLIILAAFALLLTTAYLLWRVRLQQQTQRLAVADPGGPAELAGLSLAAAPAVLYFTTPTCAQCRFQQTPALAQVQKQLSGLQVLKLDAIEHQQLADYYLVMTVPTTVVLDSRRRPVAINHGPATTERLLAQIGQANVNRKP
ncbi:MAG TPA: thioredoxin family protein [Anaerolineae bacterium]|nr:thioredoxin family protein [Anaerolineae bacterium]